MLYHALTLLPLTSNHALERSRWRLCRFTDVACHCAGPVISCLRYILLSTHDKNRQTLNDFANFPSFGPQRLDNPIEKLYN